MLRDFIRRKEEGGPLRIRKVPTYYDIVSYREIIDGSGTGTIFVVCMICNLLACIGIHVTTVWSLILAVAGSG